MTITRVQVSGLKELNEKLKLIPEKVGLDIIKDSVMEGATILSDAMAATTAFHDRTGTLRSMIKAKPQKARRYQAVVNAGVVAPRTRVQRETLKRLIKKLKGHVPDAAQKQQDAFYWRFLEYGTSRMPPHAFIRPAFDANKDAVVEKVKEAISARLDDLLEGMAV